ncbi:hypothetical protein Hdeb2414_s0010g00348891 [Helianthus debilis subsp. tardiflorus]
MFPAFQPFSRYSRLRQCHLFLAGTMAAGRPSLQQVPKPFPVRASKKCFSLGSSEGGRWRSDVGVRLGATTGTPNRSRGIPESFCCNYVVRVRVRVGSRQVGVETLSVGVLFGCELSAFD